MTKRKGITKTQMKVLQQILDDGNLMISDDRVGLIQVSKFSMNRNGPLCVQVELVQDGECSDCGTMTEAPHYTCDCQDES